MHTYTYIERILCIYGGLVAKSCPTLATPWAVAHQAPLSMGSSRQEYWSGLPFPSPGDLPDPRIRPRVYLHSSSLTHILLIPLKMILYLYWVTRTVIISPILRF